MFGFRNFTGFSFVGKVGTFGLEFTAGLVEEVTFNITTAGPANGAEIIHGAEIIEDINVKFISKDQLIASTSAAVSSKIVEANLFQLIAGATPNLII